MTLLTRHIEAGWHEVSGFVIDGVRAAEKFFAADGATSSVIRVEGKSQVELHKAIDLRESQLSNDPSVVVYPSGERVSDAQHSANQILGTAPTPQDPTPGDVGTPAPEVQAQEAALSPEDEAALAAAAVAQEPAPAPAEPALTDEERAKLASDEAELEAGKVDGVAPPAEPVAPSVDTGETEAPVESVEVSAPSAPEA